MASGSVFPVRSLPCIPVIVYTVRDCRLHPVVNNLEMNSMIWILAALLAAPAADLKQTPGDWPQFRGPNRDGSSAEKGLLQKWPADGPPKLWTKTEVGEGFSTVSVAGGVIFGSGKMKDKQEHVWALDGKSGELKWSTPFADAKTVDKGNGPRSTPTYANGFVYTVSVDGTLACNQAVTGKLVWKKSYTKDFDGAVPYWGYSESVLVDDGKVIATPGSKSAAMVALNAKTGEVIWQTPVTDPGKGGGYASAIKAELGGVPMYINLIGKTGGMIAVHAKTGRLLWQYDKVLNTTANISSPLVKDDLVFCSTGYGAGSALLKMTVEGDSVSVKELKFYKGSDLQNHHGGMVAVGDTIYFGNGHNQGQPASVDFNTAAINWKESRGAGGGDGSAAIAYADGMLYYRYQNSVIALVKADPKEFTLVSSFKIPEPSGKPSWPHPTIANGKLFIRDQDKLHCFDLHASGK